MAVTRRQLIVALTAMLLVSAVRAEPGDDMLPPPSANAMNEQAVFHGLVINHFDTQQVVPVTGVSRIFILPAPTCFGQVFRQNMCRARSISQTCRTCMLTTIAKASD